MNESVLYERRNVDNIFNRTVIAGLLNLLNHHIVYDQIWQNNVVEQVTVPFVYAFPEDYNQRFAQDFYTFFGRECFSDKLIDGKFDMLPRGAIKYSGSSIDSGNITNRFVEGTYLKDENGRLVTYKSFLYSIPLTFHFDCEIWVDNIDTAFKIEQALREAFYKNKTYNVLYRGMKIGCNAGFPESVTTDKTTTYSFDNEHQMKMTFQLAVETYQPCFDESTTIEGDCRIERFALDINHYTPTVGPKDKFVRGSFEGISSGARWFSGSNILLNWNSFSNTSDVCTISLYYITEDNVKHHIASPLFNQGEYVWNIPMMSDFKQPFITYVECDECRVVSAPRVRIVPDDNGYITTESFTILDGGRFETSSDGMLDITLEYFDKAKDTVVVSTAYSVAIESGKASKFVLNGDAVKYGEKPKPTRISLILEYPIDGQVLDKIDNILII